MFLLYNLARVGYWGSSSIMYFLTSIWSFMMNRKYTFKNQSSIVNAVVKFFANIGVCYIIAYGLAPIILNKMIDRMYLHLTANIKDQVAMVIGMFLFTGLNYIGQKFIVFRNNVGNKDTLGK